MNIDEFELNYLLLKRDMKNPNGKNLLEFMQRFLEEPHSGLVLSVYGEALQSIRASYLEVLYSQAKKFMSMRDYRSALDVLSRYLRHKDSAEAYLDVAFCFSRLGDPDTAVAYCARATQIEPDPSSKFLSVMADIEHTRGSIDFAISYMKDSLVKEYTEDKAYLLSTYHIERGDFREGWALYESRFTKETRPALYKDLGLPRWHKGIKAKSILVRWEQGFGDTFMFCRFLPLLRKHADKIYFSTRNPVKKLIQENYDFVEVVDSDFVPEDAEYQLPLMSIMHELDLSLSDIKGCKYLHADSSDINTEKMKIGISWQGAPAGIPERNMTLLDLAPLLQLDDVQIYSFQKGVGLASAKTLFDDLNAVDLGSGFSDFYETACALNSMDLFVTTDNCLANLAGALGVPTILFLHKSPEFRWMQADRSTIWYNSVEIIKQKDLGNWSDCVDSLLSRISFYSSKTAKN